MKPFRLMFVVRLALAFMTAGSGTVLADAAAPYEAFPEALGISFGRITGTGLHYHRWSGPLGYGVSGGALYMPVPDSSSTIGPAMSPWGGYVLLDYSVGGALQRRVYGDVFTDWFTGSLYLFTGLSHRGYIPVETVYADPDSETYVPPEYRIGSYAAELSTGIGIGIEIILFRHISVPAEFGYGATWTMTESDLADAFAVQLYGQTALRYRY
ncbi:MAG: hypothetical protein ACOC2Q_02765 [Spirochaetota bacterium]